MGMKKNGVGGVRTHVQTKPANAFYMFSSILDCQQELGKEQTKIIA